MYVEVLNENYGYATATYGDYVAVSNPDLRRYTGSLIPTTTDITMSSNNVNVDLDNYVTMSGFSAPNLTTAGSPGKFSLTRMPLMTKLNIPVLATIAGFGTPLFQVTGSALSSMNISSLTSMGSIFGNGNINVSNNTVLTTITLPASMTNLGTDVNFGENALNQATVDAVLHMLVLSNGSSWTGVANLAGGTNAPPSGQGLTDKATLQTRGAVVLTN
jgi:hypothetical protein